MDAGYGAYTDLRTNITALGLSYVAGIMPQTWCGRPALGRSRQRPGQAAGDLPKLLRRDGKHQPISVKKLAFGLPVKGMAQDHVAGSHGGAVVVTLCPACAFVRRIEITGLLRARPEEWLLIEWPEGEEAPTKYWFSTLPANIAFHQLVSTAKLRWRIERDYQELKQEVGLGHFEGRGWRGFHHHATLCIAAYEFLISEREDDSPLRNAFHRVVQRNYNSRSLPPEGVRHCGLNGKSYGCGSQPAIGVMRQRPADACRAQSYAPPGASRKLFLTPQVVCEGNRRSFSAVVDLRV